MPRISVIAKLRRKPVRSSRRIDHTPIWHVNDDSTRMIVAGRIRFRSPDSVVSENGLSRCSNWVGGHVWTGCPPMSSV